MTDTTAREPLRLALVGCSVGKASAAAPAHRLYTSHLFRAQLEHAQREHGGRVLILSALYGAVDPCAWLEPYDWTLDRFDHVEREHWGHVVCFQAHDWLKGLCLPTDAVELHVYAGRAYAEPIRWQLPDWQGWTVVEPLAGLQVGQRLQRLAQERGQA